jgi:hypothetical protein
VDVDVVGAGSGGDSIDGVDDADDVALGATVSGGGVTSGVDVAVDVELERVGADELGVDVGDVGAGAGGGSVGVTFEFGGAAVAEVVVAVVEVAADWPIVASVAVATASVLVAFATSAHVPLMYCSLPLFILTQKGAPVSSSYMVMPAGCADEPTVNVSVMSVVMCVNSLVIVTPMPERLFKNAVNIALTNTSAWVATAVVELAIAAEELAAAAVMEDAAAVVDDAMREANADITPFTKSLPPAGRVVEANPLVPACD